MRKRFTIVNLILLILLIFCVILTFFIYKGQTEKSYYNQARIVLKDDINSLESDNTDALTHSCYIIDLSGKVIYSNLNDVKIGEKYNLQEVLQTDKYFFATQKDKIKLVFPIEKDDVLNNIAVFLVDKSLVSDTTTLSGYLVIFSPLLWWAFIVIVMLIYINHYINSKMLRPIKEITGSSDAIVCGNYDKSIVQISTKNILNTEMDKLCYNFERMRDELKEKSIRENELKTAHKELLSCMSHDLRTPITTIKAHAEALRDKVATTEEKKEKYINTIIKKTDVVSRMISDLLDHSNAECNQLSIKKTEIYFESYIQNLCKELYVYCEKYDVEFISNINIPQVVVLADEGRITQVIYNLVENAVKYNTNDNKKIIFSCKLEKETKRIYVSVEDNGNGVSLSDISFVFNKFYRAEKSRSMQIPGAGLGLSICKYIVEAHDGEISVQNTENHGANFTFYLTYK